MVKNENIDYKHQDYASRFDDSYAITKYEIILDFLPSKNALNILNAGCGSGEMNVLLAKKNKTWNVVAIDIDDEAIIRSSKLMQSENINNLQIIKVSIEDHIPHKKYDVIIANDVIEHIENDKEVIKKMFLQLNQNGEIYISVPGLQFLFGFHDIMLGHFRRYNKTTIKKLLEPYFIIKKCRYFGGMFILLALYFSKIKQKPYPIPKRDSNTYKNKFVKFLLKIEKKIIFPLGTSLIVYGSVKNENKN